MTQAQRQVRLAGAPLERSRHVCAFFHTADEDKILFPSDGITKADLVEYYRRVGPVMLSYIRNRPVMMQRFPDGIDGEGFIQQQVPDYFPDWIRRVTVPKQGGAITHAVCNNLASIVYMANQAAITLHAWLSRVDALDCPDHMIFDLDPAHEHLDPAHDNFTEVCSSALALRDLLDELGLVAFVKTTGLFGAHVVVPLDRSANFDEVRAFARAVAEELVRRDPRHRTTEMRKEKRDGRLLVDVMRNAYGQTAVAPYCVRAVPGAPVAMPLAWQDLERSSNRETIGPRTFTIRNVSEYLDAKGDAWAGMARQARSIRTATRSRAVADRLGVEKPDPDASRQYGCPASRPGHQRMRLCSHGGGASDTRTSPRPCQSPRRT